jgi:phytoene synthase
MDEAFAHCEALVRAADKDRFLAALFAPADCRPALFALYAFNVEITQVRELVHEPLAGEVRLQWWMDVLGEEGRGAVAANPVAAALLATLRRHELPFEPLRALIAARRFDLYDDPMMTYDALEAYCADVSSSLIALAGRVLGGETRNLHDIARHGGIAFALAGLLKAFPHHSARGQLFVPLDVLARHGARRDDITRREATTELRAALAELRLAAHRHLAAAGGLIKSSSSEIMPALLPVSLARPVLDRMERPDYEPFTPFEVPQWRRQWRLWRAARRPARIVSK